MIEVMNKNASDMGVSLFMPHVAKFAYMKTHETAKWLSLVNRSEKMIQLTPEIMDILNYKLDNPIPEKILERIYYQDIFAILWYTDPRNPVTSVLSDFVKAVSEPKETIDDEGEKFWRMILEPLIIELDLEDETENVENPVEQRPVEDIPVEQVAEATIEPEETTESDPDISESNEENAHKEDGSEQQQELPQKEELPVEENLPEKDASVTENDAKNLKDTELLGDDDDEKSNSSNESEQSSIESDQTRIIIPAVWTPINQTGNAVFMYHFFRNVSSILNLFIHLLKSIQLCMTAIQ